MTYRSADLSCPACKQPLVAEARFHRCEACRGVFVDEAVLAGMFLEMSGGGTTRVPHTDLAAHCDPPAERDCPRCGERMTPRCLSPATVEHCPRDGFWFDHEEIERALRRERHPGEAPPKSDLTTGEIVTGVLDGMRLILEIISIFR